MRRKRRWRMDRVRERGREEIRAHLRVGEGEKETGLPPWRTLSLNCLSSSISRDDSLSLSCRLSCSRLSVSRSNRRWRRMFSSLRALSSFVICCTFSLSAPGGRERGREGGRKKGREGGREGEIGVTVLLCVCVCVCVCARVSMPYT